MIVRNTVAEISSRRDLERWRQTLRRKHCFVLRRKCASIW